MEQLTLQGSLADNIYPIKGYLTTNYKHQSLCLPLSVALGLLAETVVRLRLRLPPPASQLAHIYMSG